MFDPVRRASFDAVADLYAEARPGYPEVLIEDIVALAGAGEDSRLLEIGCGPATATLPLARHGCAIPCIELGPTLAQRAWARLAGFPRVKIVNADFEKAELPEQAFDLTVSGSAFHWLNPETALPKIAGALRQRGSLALFWNHQWYPDTPMGRALQKAYRTAPTISRGDNFDVPGQPPRFEAKLAKRRASIDACGFFEPVETRHYPWSASYDTESYLKLMQTYSDHATLPDDVRARLLDAVRKAIDAHGGTVEREYVSSLLFTSKRSTVS